MRSCRRISSVGSRRKSIAASGVLAIFMLFLLSTFVMARNSGNTPFLIASTIWTLFLVGITFLILRTGRVHRFRFPFFVIYAISFIVVFMSGVASERGSIALTQEVIEAREVPLCPVAIPQLLMPALLKGVLIFPTRLIGSPYGGFYVILSMWILSVLVLGR